MGGLMTCDEAFVGPVKIAFLYDDPIDRRLHASPEIIINY